MSEGPSEQNPFMSPKMIAQIFAVKPFTVRKWITDGKLHGTKIGNDWRVLKSEVQRFANEKYGSKDEPR